MRRRNKLPKSGGARKKPYYLDKYMTFLIPHVKVHSSSSGNLPQIPIQNENNQQEESEGVEGVEGVEGAEGVDGVEEDESLLDEQNPVVLNEDVQEAPKKNKATVEKPNKEKLGAVDRALMDFFETKKRKIESTDQNPRKQFLLSLLPEVDELPENMFRLFKRKVLQLLDDCAGGTAQPEMPTAYQVPSPYSIYSSSSNSEYQPNFGHSSSTPQYSTEAHTSDSVLTLLQ